MLLLNYTCPICKIEKEEDCFYKLESRIEDLSIQKQIIKIGCKDCININEIKVNSENEFQITGLLSIYKRLLQKEKTKLATSLNIKEEDLISRAEALRILKTSKSWLKKQRKMGIYKEYQINNPLNPKGLFSCYYDKNEINNFKRYTENGKFHQVCNIEYSETYKNKLNKYVILGTDSKIYIYDNKIEQKRACSKCLDIKDYNDFSRSKNGFKSHYCKICHQGEAKKRYKNFTPKEKNEMLEKTRKWQKENKDKIKIYRKIQRQNINYRIKKAISKRAQELIKKIQGNLTIEDIEKWPFYIDHCKRALKNVGCGLNEFKKHLESKFQEGMTWDNYGPGYIIDDNNQIKYQKQWSLDHIYPISKININSLAEIEQVNHYTNLRPMWAEENSSKSNKIDESIVENHYLSKKIISEQLGADFIKEYTEINNYKNEKMCQMPTS